MENSPISGGRNGTDRVPQSPPRRNAGLKAGNLSLMREGMKNDQISTGKNTSFICSPCGFIDRTYQTDQRILPGPVVEKV